MAGGKSTNFRGSSVRRIFRFKPTFLDVGFLNFNFAPILYILKYAPLNPNVSYSNQSPSLADNPQSPPPRLRAQAPNNETCVLAAHRDIP